MLRSDMPNISPDQVRAEVKKFWNALVRKSKEDVEEMYFPAATVFSSTVPRTEPGCPGHGTKNGSYALVPSHQASEKVLHTTSASVTTVRLRRASAGRR